MPRKNVGFKIIVHTPKSFDNKRTQTLFDGFYMEQVKKSLNESNLDKDGKARVIDGLIAHIAQSKLDCA